MFFVDFYFPNGVRCKQIEVESDLFVVPLWGPMTSKTEEFMFLISRAVRYVYLNCLFHFFEIHVNKKIHKNMYNII